MVESPRRLAAPRDHEHRRSDGDEVARRPPLRTGGGKTRSHNMPTVNRYARRSGLYLRDAQGGRISTYQVTPAGQRVLEGSGRGSGAKISTSDLRALQAQGLVYTHGSGPGVIEGTQSPPLQPTGYRSA